MWDLGVGVALAVLVVAGPQDPQLPDLREPPDQSCVLPVSSGLTACPDPGPRPPVSCVLPVGLAPDAVVRPDCPERDPSPESRIVPVLPATR